MGLAGRQGPGRLQHRNLWRRALHALGACAGASRPTAPVMLAAPQVGSALVLERAATPGLKGAMQDLLRVTGGGQRRAALPCPGAPAPLCQALAPLRYSPCSPGAALPDGHYCTHDPPSPPPSAGMRTLPNLCMSFFMPLPPLAALLTHLALVCLTWAPAPAFCTTRLLRDPLWLRRQAHMLDALEFLVLPLAAAHPHLGIGRNAKPKPLAIGGPGHHQLSPAA